MQNNQPLEDDRDDLVYYCKSCHSLHILIDKSMADEEWDGTYCGKCFSANIGQCTMDEWLAEEHRREMKRREIEWNK